MVHQTERQNNTIILKETDLHEYSITPKQDGSKGILKENDSIYKSFFR